jgi:hypothetical protein
MQRRSNALDGFMGGLFRITRRPDGTREKGIESFLQPEDGTALLF